MSSAHAADTRIVRGQGWTNQSIQEVPVARREGLCSGKKESWQPILIQAAMSTFTLSNIPWIS